MATQRDRPVTTAIVTYNKPTERVNIVSFLGSTISALRVKIWKGS
jgi:hypothetical protein